MLKAIETPYKGYRFRSRLEARWAVFLDALGVAWEYEKEGYQFQDGTRYLPDFWLPRHDCWVEIKGPVFSEEDHNKINALRDESQKTVVVLKSIPDRGAESVSNIESWQGTSIPIEAPDMVRMVNTMVGDHDQDDASGVRLVCPVCGFDYTHIDKAEHDQRGEYASWSGRGDAVRIAMYCENGHEWVVRFGFHKGQTWMGIEEVMDKHYDFALYLAGNNEHQRNAAYDAARTARFEHGDRRR